MLLMEENLIITPESQEAFERSIEMLDSSLRVIRQVAQQMIPEVLIREGLDAALKALCSQATCPEGTQIRYESLGLQDLEPGRAVAVYNIVRELLKNTVQHAAGEVSVLVTNRDGKISVTVEDDGKGFDTIHHELAI